MLHFDNDFEWKRQVLVCIKIHLRKDPRQHKTHSNIKVHVGLILLSAYHFKDGLIHFVGYWLIWACKISPLVLLQPMTYAVTVGESGSETTTTLKDDPMATPRIAATRLNGDGYTFVYQRRTIQRKNVYKSVWADIYGFWNNHQNFLNRNITISTIFKINWI